jgi:hypothetical protein
MANPLLDNVGGNIVLDQKRNTAMPIRMKPATRYPQFVQNGSEVTFHEVICTERGRIAAHEQITQLPVADVFLENLNQ